MRLEVSLDFSSQEFPSTARPPHTILRSQARIKKSSPVLRTRKILPTMIDETDIDDGERPTATRNGEIEFMLSQLFVHTRLRMRDTMVLVSSSRGKFFGR